MSYEDVSANYTATITISFRAEVASWDGVNVDEAIRAAIEAAVTSSRFDDTASEVLYEEAGYVTVEDDDGDEGEYDAIEEGCRIEVGMARVTVRPREAVPPPPQPSAVPSEGVPTLEASSNYWATRPVRT